MYRIDRYLESLRQGFAKAGQIAPWPMHVGSIFPYFGDLEAHDLYSRLREVASENIEQVPELFIGPSVTRALLADLIIGFKRADPPVPAEERLWFVETVFDGVERIQHGDLFNLDGRHWRMSLDGAAEVADRTVWRSWDDDPDAGVQAYRASAAAQALIWAFFFYGWTDVAFEIHGPYPVSGPDKVYNLVVREFFDLSPRLLWPEAEHLPYDSFVLMTLVEQSNDISIDAFNHMTHTQSLHETTKFYALRMGETPWMGAVEDLTNAIVDIQRRQSELVGSMDKPAVMYRFIESRYYAFRKWRMFFGDDWRPPAEVARRIGDWGIIEIPATGGPSTEDLLLAYDPRVEYALELE